ncbi:MAG TPA: M1 family aminopeptidase, partial [Chitinophagaceae bacterium]|nr:M1 family aminopeptidase [Chitinophagaceae bacterium]
MTTAMMKTLFALCCLWSPFALWAAPAPRIDYTITLERTGAAAALQVEMRFQGNGSGNTILSVPFVPGRSSIGPVLISKIRNSREYHIVQGDSSRLQVTHAPGALLTVMYTVHSVYAGSLPLPSDAFAAVVQPHYFHLLGDQLWVVPEDTTQQKYDLNLRWTRFPAGWKLHNSYGSDAPVQRLQQTITGFRHAAYMGGDFRLHRLLINGKPLYFGIRGRWSFNDEAVAEVIRQTVMAQRTYWQDTTIERFTVGLVPMQKGSEEERSITGQGLYYTFVTVATNSRAFGIPDLTFLFNHELMHHWLGGIMKQGHPENDHKWFNEGFTDYFAHRAMREGGLMDEAEYTSRINRIFAAYYNDSTHQYTNQRLGQDYWSTPAFQQLPYRRGLLFALYLNASLQQSTFGRVTLKEV